VDASHPWRRSDYDDYILNHSTGVKRTNYQRIYTISNDGVNQHPANLGPIRPIDLVFAALRYDVGPSHAGVGVKFKLLDRNAFAELSGRVRQMHMACVQTQCG
jgi:hypothetical protein